MADNLAFCLTDRCLPSDQFITNALVISFGVVVRTKPLPAESRQV